MSEAESNFDSEFENYCTEFVENEDIINTDSTKYIEPVRYNV